METNKKLNMLPIALLLQFFTVASFVLCKTYIDQLFLSTYPKSWLPFYFFGQTAIMVILTFGITPYISKGSKSINCSILLTSSVLVLISAFLLDYNIPGFPFLFSLWLSALAILIGIISMNSISETFDMREFKQIIRWVSAAGSLGGLLTGFSIPFIISAYNSRTLLFILIALILLSIICITNLKPIPVIYKKLKGGKTPLKYPLFINLAIGLLFLMMIDTFADYALKTEIMSVYTDDNIAKFMGPFYGIVSILTLIIQIGFSNMLLKFIGIAGLFAFVPFFSIVSGLGIIAYPGLWMAAFFRLTENIFHYSLDNIAREIAARPLPSQIRKTSKIFLKGIVMPLGTGIGALIIWLFSGNLGIQVIAFITILISIIWLFTITKTKKLYQNTLAEAVRIRRFGEISSDNLETNNANIAYDALKSDNPDTIRFGFMMLENSSIENLPEEILTHLNSPFADIRSDAVKIIGKYHKKDSIDALINRLKIEQDSNVLWHILKTLSNIDPDPAIPLATELLKSFDPKVMAGAVLVLINAGNLDTLLEAVTVLKEMLNSPNAAMRKEAVSVIGALKTGKLEKELNLLLNDTDDEVIISAITAIGSRKSTGLLNKVVSLLGNKKFSRHASRTLVQIGTPAISHLLEIIKTNNRMIVRAAIKTLILIQDKTIEDNIIELTKSSNVILNSILSRETALMARYQPITATLKKRARQLVIKEAETIQILKSSRKVTALADHIKSEIAARQRMAEIRMLYWFAVATKPAEVIDIMPALFPSNLSKTTVSRRSSAIELLDSLSTDSKLRNAILLFEKNIMLNQSETLRKLRNVDDQWLKRVLITPYSTYEGGTMDITQKIMFFRQVKLFENLPGEVLLTIAEESDIIEITESEKVFSRGDTPDGLYIVASGCVYIIKDNRIVSELNEYDFFGEIGLLDNSTRMADAVAKTDGMLIYIDKEIFDSITEDLPEVLKAVTKWVIGYLKNDKAKIID